MKVSKVWLQEGLLEYLRWVEETGEDLVVMEDDVPVLRIVPIRRRRPARDELADVRGRVVYHEDLLDPATDEWTET